MAVPPILKDPAFLLGLWGAAVSTALAAREILHARQRVRVSCGGVLGDGWGRVLCIAVVNVGRRPITVGNAGIFTRRRMRLLQPHPTLTGPWPLPKLLGEGEAVDVYLDLAALRADLHSLPGDDEPVWAFVRDAHNRDHWHRLDRFTLGLLGYGPDAGTPLRRPQVTS